MLQTLKFLPKASLMAALVFSTAAYSENTSAAAKGADYNAPRNSLGQPDLQGVWDFRTLTPLQRPAELGRPKRHCGHHERCRDCLQ